MRYDLANLLKKKGNLEKRMLFFKHYRVNEDLSRFFKSLSIAELVRIYVEHHRQLHLGKQAFLSVIYSGCY